jgi:hypothetical protein
MDPIQARLNLQADLERIEPEIARQHWVIDPWPPNACHFYVSMTSDIDHECYTLYLECSDYPEQPPSIKCVNSESKDPSDPKDWPNCEGFRPPPTADLCLNISREALKQLHPNWQNDPRIAWDQSGNPIWRVLAALQDRLSDGTKYHGRTK